MKTSYRNKGFTLLELMITIAIAGILAGLAIPNWLAWRAKAKINGAATNLRGDLEMAKMRAIKENAQVSVAFAVATNGYTVFIDNGALSANYIREADEQILTNRQLVPGVSLTILLGFGGNSTGFNGRGHAGKTGTAAVTDSAGRQRQIIINRVGRIQLQYN